MKKSAKFTLVELMVVVLIISILAGLGFAGYSYANAHARESSTRSLIKQIEAGFESINTKLGYYPATPENTEGTSGFQEIEVTFNNGEVTKIKIGDAELPADARKEFLRVVDAESLRESPAITTAKVSDSWGNPIYYRNNSSNFNKSKVDIFSAGPDGMLGKENKSEPKDVDDSRSSFLDGSDWGCDDIANFE